MAVTINYTKGSTKAHLHRRLSKQSLAERREKQQLAQHRLDEAVKRAVFSKNGVVPLSPTARNESTAATRPASIIRPWAFRHARRQGDRWNGPSVSYTSASTVGQAYSSVSREELEHKKHKLLATTDWSRLSRSKSPSARRSDVPKRQVPHAKSNPGQAKVEKDSTQQADGAGIQKVKRDRLCEADPKLIKEERQDTSATDIYMPSSPPKPDMTLSSSIVSTFSSSLTAYERPSGSLPDSTAINEPASEDTKPSSEALATVMSSEIWSSSQCASEEKSGKTGLGALDVKPVLEDLKQINIKAGLQYLGPSFQLIQHIRDLDASPILFNFYLPCMLGDDCPPFMYDGMSRSNDYFGMAFAGPDMEY